MGKFLSGQRNIESITVKYSTPAHILYVCCNLTVCIVIYEVNVSLQCRFTVRVPTVLHSCRAELCTLHFWCAPSTFEEKSNQPFLSLRERLWRWNKIWWVDQHPVSSAKSLIARAHPLTSKRKINLLKRVKRKARHSEPIFKSVYLQVEWKACIKWN